MDYLILTINAFNYNIIGMFRALGHWKSFFKFKKDCCRNEFFNYKSITNKKYVHQFDSLRLIFRI